MLLLDCWKWGNGYVKVLVLYFRVKGVVRGGGRGVFDVLTHSHLAGVPKMLPTNMGLKTIVFFIFIFLVRVRVGRALLPPFVRPILYPADSAAQVQR